MFAEAHGALQDNVRVLQLSGLWPPARMRGWALLFPVYTGVLYLCFLSVLFAVLELVYLSQRDINELTYALIVVMSHLGVLFKMTHFLSHRGAYLRLVGRLNGLIQQTQTDVLSDPQSVLTACHRKAMRLTYYTFAYLALTGLIWYLLPILDMFSSASTGRRLPVVNTRWIDNNNTALYALGYAVQFPSIFYFVAISVGLDGFFATAMIHVAAQLQLLNLRLSQLNKSRSPVSAATEFSGVHKQECWSPLALWEIESHEESGGMYHQLVQEIKRHQEIVSFVKFLETVMSPVAFIQFLFSVGSICVTLFQATFNPRPDVVFKCAMYLPTPVFQIYIYCWCGHNIMEEGARVSLAAYSCAWTEASKRTKNALRMLVCSTQRPLLLTGGKIYPISKATFLSMINASYSLFAVLQQMRSR
nr:odorant receptor SameORX [Schistocerca americana]